MEPKKFKQHYLIVLDHKQSTERKYLYRGSNLTEAVRKVPGIIEYFLEDNKIKVRKLSWADTELLLRGKEMDTACNGCKNSRTCCFYEPNGECSDSNCYEGRLW